MKRNAFCCFALCVCVLVSALLNACTAPELPEGSSAPAEESSMAVSVPEDPNAKAVRAYLEELLEAERATGTVDWLTSGRAEVIRESVKQLKTPFLTEEDVLRIAEQAMFMVSAERAEQARSLLLPPCGVLAQVEWSPTVYPRACESFYMALVSYTLYLFTPPDFLFREEEVLDRVSLTSSLWLYLPLAGDYTSRSEALSLLREGKNGVELPFYGLGSNDEHPLDCFSCGTPVLFCGSGERQTLDLEELAQRMNVTLPKGFFIARADAYLRDWLDRILNYDVPTGVYSLYDLPDGSAAGMYQLLSAEDAKEIRKQVELLPEPILTSGYVMEMVLSLLDSMRFQSPLLLLPGVDGAEDVLLPPGVESWEDVQLQDDTIVAAKAYNAAAYLIDLFTPSAYRFTDLTDRAGVYYELDDGTGPIYLLVAESNGLYVVNDALYLDPLYIVQVPWEEEAE